jgi:uncharacterized protein (DUF433 family)
MEFRRHRFRRITLDPGNCFGKLGARQLRVRVSAVMREVAGG